MKYAKMLGLLAVAASALMAFAGTASALLTNPTGTVLNKGAKIHAVNHGGHLILDPASLPAFECASTLEGEVESNGGTNVKLTSFTLGSPVGTCTNSWHVTTVATGTLIVQGDGKAGTYEGTVFSSGMTITATRLGIECHYSTNATHIGTIAGGNPATLVVEANLTLHGGSTFCGHLGSTSFWFGAYQTTAPLYIDG
jgi:hypothetical protein